MKDVMKDANMLQHETSKQIAPEPDIHNYQAMRDLKPARKRSAIYIKKRGIHPLHGGTDRKARRTGRYILKPASGFAGDYLPDFESVNWDFTESPAKDGIHSIHPYPARFISQIPRKLIELFCPASGIVLDPFCGSGTTLVEAMAHGIDACGIDLNPLACLISRVKCSPAKADLNSVAESVILWAEKYLSSDDVAVPPIPNVDHWFKKDVQVSLSSILKAMDTIDTEIVREDLEVALSSIVVRVSNQESDTRYAAIDKEYCGNDVLSLFRRAVSRIALEKRAFFNRPLAKWGKVTVINADILRVKPIDIPGPVGLVITSPPYPNAYEYWLYHKYRMYWLGMDPLKVKALEIGARPHYFKKNAQDEHDFERQMGDCFALLSCVVIKGGKVCFLVGRSIIHGRRIDNGALLERAAIQHSFRRIATAERHIMRNRKSFNPTHSQINEESVIIFERTGTSQ